MTSRDDSALAADVLILGGGPAGAVAALGLAAQGFDVLVVEPRAEGEARIGEVLSGSAAPILSELGVWDGFVAQRHEPSHAVRSVWGEPQELERSLIFDPYGSGWHLDRARFDRLLLDAAEARGARVLRGSLARAVRSTAAGVEVELSGVAAPARRAVRARFVIDATGRQAWLSRRLGASWRRHDRLVAWARRYTTSEASHVDPVNLIEAVEDGWWYSAPLPNRELLVVFMTDADLGGRGDEAPIPRRFRERIGAAEPIGNARAWPASSGLVRRQPGDNRGWLATGDAAAAFDPLAGHGICFALRAGQHAALASAAWLHGQRAVPEQYEQHIAATFDAYLAERAVQYGRETRFKDRTFWQRRADAPNS